MCGRWRSGCSLLGPGRQAQVIEPLSEKSRKRRLYLACNIRENSAGKTDFALVNVSEACHGSLRLRQVTSGGGRHEEASDCRCCARGADRDTGSRGRHGAQGAAARRRRRCAAGPAAMSASMAATAGATITVTIIGTANAAGVPYCVGGTVPGGVWSPSRRAGYSVVRSATTGRWSNFVVWRSKPTSIGRDIRGTGADWHSCAATSLRSRPPAQQKLDIVWHRPRPRRCRGRSRTVSTPPAAWPMAHSATSRVNTSTIAAAAPAGLCAGRVATLWQPAGLLAAVSNMPSLPNGAAGRISATTISAPD